MVDHQGTQVKVEVATTVDLLNLQEGIDHHTLDLEVINNHPKEIMVNQCLIKDPHLHQHKLGQVSQAVVLFLQVQFQVC